MLVSGTERANRATKSIDGQELFGNALVPSLTVHLGSLIIWKHPFGSIPSGGSEFDQRVIAGVSG